MWPKVHAIANPDRPAVVMAGSGRIVTYGELEEESSRLASLFLAEGMTAGDVLAILMDNDARYLTVCWAARRIGLYYVPVNWHLTRQEADYVIRNSGARALVANGATAFAEELAAQNRQLRLALSVDATLSGFDDLDAASRSVGPVKRSAELEGRDIVYSSGTTGLPKGGRRALSGRHPADGQLLGAELFKRLRLDSNSVYLTPGAPLYHAAPLRFAIGVTQLGATNVLLEQFDAKDALTAMSAYSVTHSQWVPTMFVRLLRLSDRERRAYDLTSHVAAVHAAAPCPVNVKQQMIDWWGPIVHEYYGASEGGGATYISAAEWLGHRGSVGRPYVGIFHILDDAGGEALVGEAGQIYVEGGTPVEYLGDAEKTAVAHNDRGWVTVGDLGCVDAEGYLYLRDRRTDLIISGGVNIYPQEVEDVLIANDAVADVAVIGVDNEEFGQEVLAVVEPVESATAGEELERTLIEFCRSQLSRYKCPRSVVFIDNIPRTPSGKVLRRLLREGYTDQGSKLQQ